MNARSSWPAALAAAAVFIGLPAKTNAEHQPTRLQDPPNGAVIFNDDSDPWRPDNPPAGTYRNPAVSSTAADAPVTPVQPAIRHESWIDILLRLLRFFMWGGSAR